MDGITPSAFFGQYLLGSTRIDLLELLMNAIIIISDNFGERENMKKTKIIAAVIALLMAGGSMNYIQKYVPDNVITANAETYIMDGDLTYKVYSDYAIVTNCSNYAVGSITIPSTIKNVPVTTIGEHAFMECKQITSIKLPDSITVIEQRAFSSCEELKSVTIGNNVKSIGVRAFHL